MLRGGLRLLGYRIISRCCVLEFVASWSFSVSGGAYEGLTVGDIRICSPFGMIKMHGEFGDGMPRRGRRPDCGARQCRC